MEKYYKDKYLIPSARLQGYDYSSDGTYFVTICIGKLICYFGEIVNSEVKLSEMGKIAFSFWKEIPEHFDNVILDEFKIMPNHIHGIIIIDNSLKKNNNLSRDEEMNKYRGDAMNKCRDEAIYRSRDEAMPRLYTNTNANTKTNTNTNTKTNIKTNIKTNANTNKKHFNKKMSDISPKPKSLSVIIGSFKSICTRTFNKIGYKYFAWQPRFHDHIIRNRKELFNIREYIIKNPANWEGDEMNPIKNKKSMH